MANRFKSLLAELRIPKFVTFNKAPLPSTYPTSPPLPLLCPASAPPLPHCLACQSVCPSVHLHMSLQVRPYLPHAATADAGYGSDRLTRKSSVLTLGPGYAEELLHAVSTRANDDYRRVSFKPKPQTFRKRVSFDVFEKEYDAEISPATLPRLFPVDRILFLTPKYPTQPVVLRQGVLMSLSHPQYTGGARRTLLVYVSGRVHTWVGLDYVLRLLAVNGDAVVVVAAVSGLLSGARGEEPPYFSAAPRARQRQRHRPEFVAQVAQNVLAYAACVNPQLVCRITVEIMHGRTKDVLRDAYRLYEPNLVCVGAKSGAAKAPLKLWQLSRLSDRLVKNFPLPVVVVPACTMLAFELGIQKDLSPTQIAESSDEEHDADIEDEDELDGPERELLDDASVDLSALLLLYLLFVEIADLYNAYQRELLLRLAKAKKQPVDVGYFASLARVVSSQLLQFCEDLRGVDPDFKGKGALLARGITGLTSFGRVPYKTKLLLPPEEPRTLVLYTEIRRNLRRNQLSPPLISISEGDSVELPRATALRFDTLEQPLRGTRDPRRLKKFLSNEDAGNKKVSIEPLKLHPDLHGLGEKKKKKKFWKLFR